ncbi:MAG: hypothetical protein RLN87_13920 [Parasphingopyxis sp.]|uniref:hypothetical protein n=1 Tax=Parasphingopyxis sp. TaxID=1920299 RepID=UPI00262B62CC|nr:hypothetical protein [uncultured Parasphingopyxis sp.]
MKQFGIVAWGIAAALAVSACSGSSSMDEDDARAALDTVNDINDQLESGDGVGMMEVDENAGPAERVTAESYNIITSDDRRFLRQATQAGMIELLEFRNVTPSSPVLRRCDAIAALEAEADENATHFPERIEQIEAMARRVIDNPRDYQDFLTGFRGGQADGARNYRRNWELNADIAAAAADMCRVLARGRWQLEGGQPAFTNDADLAEFNGHAARLSAAQMELNQSVQRAMAQSRSRAQNMERSLR